MRLSEVTVLFALALAPTASAAGFLTPRRASLASLVHDVKEMPKTEHDKEPGGGYNKGSPLYAKQEALKKQGAATPAPKPSTDAIDPSTVASGAELKYPWQRPLVPVYTWAFVMYCLEFIFTFVLIDLLIALIWRTCDKSYAMESHKERDNNIEGKWAYHLFSTDHCFGGHVLTLNSGHHMPVCLCSWCCPTIRMADTYSKHPWPIIKSFWVALVIISLLVAMYELTAGVSALVFLCMAVYCRQQIRKKYGLEQGGSTIVLDCLSWICCPCCTIAQEARQVDFVDPRDGGKYPTGK